MPGTETVPAVLGEEEAAVPVGELVAFGLAMEKAHEALAMALRRAETAETELSELSDRIGTVVRASVTAERKRISVLADRHGAVYAGDEGNATRFSALLEEAPDA